MVTANQMSSDLGEGTEHAQEGVWWARPCLGDLCDQASHKPGAHLANSLLSRSPADHQLLRRLPKVQYLSLAIMLGSKNEFISLCKAVSR